ncbi:MAG: hypothetical protein HWE30_17340 [Methylocystaceae bacterium]|nr:hypothetical protein [Methylocystaceae bacterium]
MKMPFFSFICTLSLSLSVWASDPLVETGPNGSIDWSQGYVEATGQGTSRYMGNRIQEELMAKQAARTTAQARLLEQVNGIRLTGLSTLGAHSQSDTRAATRIKGTLKGAKTVSETAIWHKDESSRRGEVVLAEITLRLCVSPSCRETSDDLTTASLAETPPNTKQTEKAPSVETTGPTAVIIDLNKALYLPALAPEVIDENDVIVYSQDMVSEEAVREKGLIHYTKTVDQAKTLSISGKSPVVLTAKRITKDNRIVLSQNDGQTLSGLPAAKLGRVIVALD